MIKIKHLKIPLSRGGSEADGVVQNNSNHPPNSINPKISAQWRYKPSATKTQFRHNGKINFSATKKQFSFIIHNS